MTLAHIRSKKKDEYYTPRILVDVILPYIPQKSIVWCPFDTKNSEFVLALQERGTPVIFGHIATGQDFFDPLEEPEEYDVIVSNPPFSLKMEVLKRLYELDRPFAMLLPLPILNYHVTGDFFLQEGKDDLQLLIVNKKVSYDGGTSAFNTSYFCRDMLPRDLMFASIANNNASKHHVPSRMYGDFEESDDKLIPIVDLPADPPKVVQEEVVEKTTKQVYVNADEMSAQGCSGGICEITF